MNDKKNYNNFYRDLDRVKKEILKFLNNYPKSEILQKHFLREFEAFIYGNLIQNFFGNLNQKNISELKLPSGKIGVIKRKYGQIKDELKLAISLKSSNVNKEYYIALKKKVERDFPGFEKIFSEIEKIIKIRKIEKYILVSKKDLSNSSKPETSLNDFFVIKILEEHIKVKKEIPTGKKLEKLIKDVSKSALPKFSKEVKNNLDKDSKKMLNSQRRYQRGFESRLYQRWKTAFDLLECLIRVALESGEAHKNKLAKTTNKSNMYKRAALIKIHARAVHIANEILVLLKAGYADGANARWRSLHELAIISFFLNENNDDVSKRYLDHDIVKRFKEAKDYKKAYKKLGYPPLGRKEFNKLKKENDNLIKNYGKEFKYVNGFEWIPKNILSNRNFRALEEHVRLEKLHPFYNLSSNSVHGGARGFYRLGLMDKWQDKILLAGASNYGLADPLQNTAISLLHVSVSLLAIEPDFDSIVQMQVIDKYVKEIGLISVKIQKQIESDEKKFRK